MAVKPPSYTIDGKGTVIIKLPDGGTIRDNGTEIHFSGKGEKSEELTAKVAKIRRGQAAGVDNHKLRGKNPRQKIRSNMNCHLTPTDLADEA